MEQPEGFCCHFQYNEALFEAATIARMAGHFQKLLESIGANQLQAISLLPIIDRWRAAATLARVE